MKNSIVPLELSDDTAPVLASGPAAPGPYYGQDWAPPPSDEEQGGGTASRKLRRYWAAVKRFWWLVTGFTALGTAAGIAATQYVKPVYEAQASIFINDIGNASQNPGPVRNTVLLPPGSWIELFRNFSVVDSVVVKQQLWYTPLSWQDSVVLNGIRPTQNTEPGFYTLTVHPTTNRYELSEKKRGVVETGVVGDSIGRSVGLAWRPWPAMLASKPRVNFMVQQLRPVAVGTIDRLGISLGDNTNIMRVQLTGDRKRKTADVLNAWIDQFVTKATELRRNNLELTGNVLESQVEAARQKYQDASERLLAFRNANAVTLREYQSATSTVPGGGAADQTLSEYARLKADYAELRRNRIALDQLAADARAGRPINPEDITAITSTAKSLSLTEDSKQLLQKLSQLRDQQRIFTDSVRSVKELAGQIDQLRRETIANDATNFSRALRAQEENLLARQRDDSVKLQNVPGTSIQEAQLQNEVDIARGILNNTENKYETTRTGAVSSIPDVSILSRAAPTTSSQASKQILLVGGGIFGSLVFGVILALLLDMIDHRFRYPEQISDELRLDILGAVPAVPKPGETADPEATLQSIEAFRGLRMNMHHAFDAPPVMLTISSPGAGDGKSMISSNLALSFADAGYRTLLIDGDIRRGKLHSVFNIERRPGLLDYLAGDADVTEILRPVPMHAGLTAIPSGTRRHRGPELLTSARLPALLNWARGKYDVILMDSAPLAAGVDAYALGVATGSMILVMRTGVTDRRVAKAKLKLMERMPIRMLGAVVNAVPAAGLYSEYSYLYGYQPDIDVDLDGKKTDPLPALQSVDPPR